MFKKLLILCFALPLAACMGAGEGFGPIASTNALAPNTAMPTGEKTATPIAFAEFCVRNPQECKLPATEDMLAEIATAQAETKALVIPEEENGTDVWQSRTDVGPGDCEDFALTMRRILRGRYPEYSGSFLIATAYTEENQYHAVLTIETSVGTIVCDIRFPECAPWDALPYQWRLREVAGADFWQELGPVRNLPQTATAASGR
ncbi:transglutaminase-like cysteine peptidase [Kordiimonas lacus]|uniref:Predicted transglutaminase-like cysteine proteinase n=1 Tax=Kordiimonas lacus TaxID=637679 RepID=A0A1G7BHD7_9PROT|nr:transglutaminase-like cysteine peptidase [Kordiimonas lacus]SDE26444.1 Predicted transglutaminase-like cysteine proteinase [Kordiimonas lacus]